MLSCWSSEQLVLWIVTLWGIFEQPTLVLWGEQDQVFPLELGYRLTRWGFISVEFLHVAYNLQLVMNERFWNRHIGEAAQIAVIKNAGHALNIEKPKEFAKHIKSFLFDPPSTSTSPSDSPPYFSCQSSWQNLSFPHVPTWLPSVLTKASTCLSQL